MTRHADPSRCPDCRAALVPGGPACPSCGLPLRGDTAAQLFATLARADQLLAVLRASTAQTAPELLASQVRVPVGTPYPAQPAAPRRRRLGAASVPAILLSLGAGCLLVAALVFLAVAWSVLGVGGRTAVLVALTGLAVVLTGWAARRGLRGAAESLGLVAAGLLLLDLLGAWHAGWFGGLDDPGFTVLAGAVLAGAGVWGALATRRTTTSGLLGPEAVAALGAAGAAAGAVVVLATVPALLLVVVAGAACATGAARLHLRVVAAGTSGVAALAWLALTAEGLDRALGGSWSTLWGHLAVWPLLAAAAVLTAGCLAPRAPRWARVALLAGSHLLLVVAVLGPTERLASTPLTLVAVGVLVATGAGALVLPRPWGLVGVLTQGVAALVVLVTGSGVGERAVSRVLEAADPVWAGRVGDRLPAASGGPAGWLLPLGLLVLLGTAAVLAVAADTPARRVTRWIVPAAALLTLATSGAVALAPVPVWLPAALLLAAGTVGVGGWLRDGSPTTAAMAAVLAGAGLVLSAHAAGLTAVAATVTVLLAAVVHLRRSSRPTSAVAGGLVPLLLATAAWAWGDVASVPPTWLAVVGLVLLGAPALGLRGPEVPRVVREAATAVAAVGVALAGLDAATSAEAATWAAVYLTLSGGVVTLVSLLREDRRSVAWAGGLLLALASWVRLWDVGVRAPEAYTLPSAAVLLAVGLLRLRRVRSAGSVEALAPGLSLALVPSLLWVLVEPTGLRVLLLGLGCLALVLAGARLRWTAPLLLGAAVGALVALRLGAPYVGDAVPRWVLLGGAGALLVTAGATWERRLVEARRMASYVRGLR